MFSVTWPFGNQRFLADCRIRNFSRATVYSGNYCWSLSTATITITRVATRAPSNCIEPDSFGFTDENGKEHIAKIPEGQRKAIYSALGNGDVAALKVEAAVTA